MDYPKWSEQIKTHYLSGASNQFVVHGNVNDRLLLPGKKGKQPRLGNLSDYLVDSQLRNFDLVLSYELGSGLRIERGEDLYEKLRFEHDLPRDPAGAIGFLDHLFRYLVNLRNLDPGEQKADSKNPAGRNHHVAVIIRSAELVFPMSRQTRDYQLSSMAAVVRSWSHETYFLEQNLAVFLISENLNDLHHLLTNNSRAAHIELAMPSAEELVSAFQSFFNSYPKALANFEKSLEVPANRLAGATLSSIETLLKKREYTGSPLVEEDLSDLKKELVEKDAQGLIEFLEPDRTLDDVFGSDAAKTWMRQDIELWRQDDLAAMPMGYLLCGPVGTGKTYLVECLAGEAGIPVVKMKNFRDRWVGSTEGNLEKIFSLLHALGRCIVFVDEADQALGNRNAGSGDSGVSGRVYSMMAKEMSQTENRGKILWILASSRPDYIEVDLKRPGRIDVKIPLFPAPDAEGGYQLIRALCRKHDLDLPNACPGDLIDLIPEWVTPGGAESIAIKVYRLVKTKSLEAMQALRDCLDDYQNPIAREVMEFQIGLAVSEASDLDFVPEVFREYRND